MGWATVTLYTHAFSEGGFLGQLVAGAAAALAGIPDKDEETNAPARLTKSSQAGKHWCLLVHFDEDPKDRVWLCDLEDGFGNGRAGNNASNAGILALLAPITNDEIINFQCRPVSLAKLRSGKTMERMFQLGRVRMSPSRLKELCRLNGNNGKIFDVNERNCQDCVEDLCGRMNLSLEPVYTRADNPLEAVFQDVFSSFFTQ